MHGRLTEEGDYISIFDEFYEGDEVENPLAYTGAVDRLKENIDTLKYQFSTVTDKLRYYEYEIFIIYKGITLKLIFKSLGTEKHMNCQRVLFFLQKIFIIMLNRKFIKLE